MSPSSGRKAIVSACLAIACAALTASCASDDAPPGLTRVPVAKESTSPADELGIGQQSFDRFGYPLATGEVVTVHSDQELPDAVAADIDARVGTLSTSNDPAASMTLLMEYSLIANDVAVNAGRTLYALVPVAETGWWEVLTIVDGQAESARAETREAALEAVQAQTATLEPETFEVAVVGS